MESQPLIPDFRNNPENFHPLEHTCRDAKPKWRSSGIRKAFFRIAAYFTIKVQNALKQVSCKTSFSITEYSTLFLPPKCMAESFTSTSCIIFSSLQLDSERAKDMYNLINFCIHTTFFAKQSILFCITGGFSDFLPLK